MSWNLRIIAFDIDDDSLTYYSVREVYYDEDGNITAISTQDFPMGSCDLDNIKLYQNMIKSALDKPILKASDMDFIID